MTLHVRTSRLSAWLLRSSLAWILIAGAAWGEAASAQPVVTIRSVMLSLTDTTLSVDVGIASTYEVASVEAEVAGRRFPLTYYEFRTGRGYRGAGSLAGVPYGTYTLTVTATDVFGTAGVATQSYTQDLPPVIAVTLPVQGLVTSDDIRIQASCTDDAPEPCQLYAILTGSSGSQLTVPIRPSSLDETVDVTSLVGPSVRVVVKSVDSGGHQAEVTRDAYLVDSPYLERRLTLGSGFIVDLYGDRVLIAEQGPVPASTGGGWEVLHVYDRGTQSLQRIPTPPSRGAMGGHIALTPSGAVYVATNTGVGDSPGVYGWNGSTLTRIGETYLDYSFHAAGDFAVWSDDRLRRGQVSTGTAQIVADSYTPGRERGPAVSAQGQVLYQSGSEMRLFTGPSTFGVGTATSAPEPTFDGETPYFRGLAGIYRVDGGTSTLVAGSGAVPADRARFLASNGWLAFERPAGGGGTQIWRRAPDGTERQVTFFSTPSTLEALSPDGQVLFRYNGERYWDTGAGLAAAVGPAVGTPYWDTDGAWTVPIGNTLFRLLATPTAGVPVPTAAASLGAPRPNPVSSEAVVPFHTDSDGDVALEVFDVQGRRVATLVAERLPAGAHVRTWAPGALPAGVYLLRLTAGGTSATRRVVVAR